MKIKSVCFLAAMLIALSIHQAFAEDKDGGTDDQAKETQESVVSTETVKQAEEVVASLGSGNKKIMTQWLHMLDKGGDGDISDAGVLAYAPEVPQDLARIFGSAGGREGGVGFAGLLLRSVLAIMLAYGVVRFVQVMMKKKLAQVDEHIPPGTDGLTLVWVGFIRTIPRFVAILLFAVVATSIFLVMAGSIEIRGRMFFQALLGVFLIFMATAAFCRIFFSPDNDKVRPLEMKSSLAMPLYRACYVSLGVLFSGLLVIRFVQELGAMSQTVSWVVIILGSAVILTYILLIFSLKKPVADGLLSQVEKQEGGWIRQQLAGYWHILALIYLLLVWFFWVGQQLTGATGQKGAFIVSMFVVPLYFILSHIGRTMIGSSVEALNLGNIGEDEFADDIDEAEKEQQRTEKRKSISRKVHQIFKTVLSVVLLLWFLSLWGVHVPFASAALAAVFESIVALALALVAWRFASSYITRKLEESEPETVENEEDFDDEFGGAAERGRSHTLLPLLRKAIGTVLVVMVLLIVISSLGVNIAPLLAGAGVIGLAVGFGAQKLVSDVLSGFFFLLDDAFRVGEYIQAGSIRGTVEAITLRNVMLRHHLGMLQVVPHSELGAITNYMRGGIVVKFPLEFPYDTDIDKVRKIIKKTGIAMLQDEELADDFIAPLKSQGVHEITNSVMVIRVKFTAKPGKQFVIKREAFRRITEALNAKGIYYAHRKVIVDFPDEAKAENMDPQVREKALEAGAAAAIAMEDEQQQQKK